MRTQAEFEAMFNCKAPAGQPLALTCSLWHACLLAQPTSTVELCYPAQQCGHFQVITLIVETVMDLVVVIFSDESAHVCHLPGVEPSCLMH